MIHHQDDVSGVPTLLELHQDDVDYNVTSLGKDIPEGKTDRQ